MGRDEELELAREAVVGVGAGLVITGVAGVGKTRIADELLTELSAKGHQVLRLLATRAAATIPFGAAASLLADRPDAPGDLTSEIAAAVAALHARASQAPLVVGVDDAHLLDDASAQLVYHLARAGDAKLIVTARSAETAPSFVDALWQEGLCQRLELQPLSRDEVARLLAAALEGQVEQHSADTFWRVTAGNVLFLRELCRDTVARGQLVHQHGVWTWTSGIPVLSARLQELLDARVGQLDEAAREAASLLALGEPLPRTVLLTLTSAEAVAELDGRGLIAATSAGDEGALRLAHPLYAESLRGRLGPMETSGLYTRLADGLVARHADPTNVARRIDPMHDGAATAAAPLRGAVTAVMTIDDRLRVAVWSVSSGRPAPPALLAEAAGEALGRGDAALAEQLARAAPGHAPATLVLAEALGTLRRGAEAEALLAPLAEENPTPEDAAFAVRPSWATRVAIARLVAHRSPDLALDDAWRLAATTGEAADDPAERDLIQATLADTLGYRGRGTEAGALAVGLMASTVPAARAVAVGPAVAWLVRLGRVEDAVAAGREVLAETQVVTPGRLQPSDVLVASLGTALLAAGRLDELDDLLATATTTTTSALDELQRSRGTVAFLQGYAALLRGRPDSAREPLREAVLGFQRSGTFGHQAFALALLAEAEALLGDAERARRTWAALPESVRADLPIDLRRSAVWVRYAEDGDAGAAAADAAAGARLAEAQGARFFAMTLAYTAVELGDSGHAPWVVELARGLQGPLAAAVHDHAAALVARDGRRLEAAAAQLDRLGLRLFAAEAYVHAAQVLRRTGSTTRADSASRQASTLRAGCEGARTPLLEHGAIGADLTPREREVALLAVRGMTSRAISERLGVSIRTVDNQLGRVYTKLGISGRQELADIIDRL